MNDMDFYVILTAMCLSEGLVIYYKGGGPMRLSKGVGWGGSVMKIK